VDTPITELGFAGLGVGAAMVGLRPIIEFMTWNFALLAFDQLFNSAAKMLSMSGGQFKIPVTFRGGNGIAHQLGATHSHRVDAIYSRIPGLVVVAPSTPYDAKGLLKSAIRCDDPVVYLEHKDLWGLAGEVPDDEHLVELGAADVAREGRDVTIVTWSAMRHRCLDAADALAGLGIEAEVIDLRTLWPWDRDAVFASVERTGRLVVVHEAVAVAGFGAEIAASVAEALHGVLKAPVRRLGAPRVPVSYAPPLENQVRVGEERIIETARALVGPETVA
jgi:acetoin:2,6-dichlorophenolindophenol oxidoreductase subunit beta